LGPLVAPAVKIAKHGRGSEECSDARGGEQNPSDGLSFQCVKGLFPEPRVKRWKGSAAGGPVGESGFRRDGVNEMSGLKIEIRGEEAGTLRA
jgi:hypothetical protein